MSAGHTPGIVSMLPVHDGDGYSWGGDVIVTFGERSINLGTSQNYEATKQIRALADLLAAAPDLLEASRIGLVAVEAVIEAREGELKERGDDAEGDVILNLYRARAAVIRAAIAKATGAA